jgi:HEAT repeat protein
MKSIFKYLLVGAFVLGLSLPAFGGGDKSEAELVKELDSPQDKIVCDALQGIEKQYPASVEGLAKAKSLLTDSRVKVREKAARMLGALHAEVSADDLKHISALLNSPEKTEVMEGLKALRGLKAQSEIPKIVALLQNPESNIKRDACRTLAVLADKSVIPSIEPLLQSPDKAVVKDANDAIFALKSK